MKLDYLRWNRAFEARMKYEAVLKEEAEKVFRYGGQVKEVRTVRRTQAGKQVEDVKLVLQYGSYVPKQKLSPKGLKKLGIFVEEVIEKAKKRKKRKKQP